MKYEIDLPPHHPWRHDLEVAPKISREAVLQAIVWKKTGIAGPLLKGAPTADVAASLALGEHPTTIAPDLTRDEACEWVRQTEYTTPLEWLWANVIKRENVFSDVTSPKSIAVVRWVQQIMNDPPRRKALLRNRPRSFRLRVAGPIVRRLEEIRACDIHKSPARTIEAAELRMIENEWDGPDELCEEKRWEKNLPSGVEVLRHYSSLKGEGLDMSHCVADYAKDVASKKCIIVSVTAPDGSRSTAEIVNGKIGQHVGRANASPTDSCVKLLNQAVDHIRRFRE